MKLMVSINEELANGRRFRSRLQTAFCGLLRSSGMSMTITTPDADDKMRVMVADEGDWY